MILMHHHRWNLTPPRAVLLQHKMAGHVIRKRQPGSVKTVAGIDVGILHENICAAVVVFSYPELKLIEAVTAAGKVVFPYVPGLLSFREGPVIIESLKRLTHKPDLLIFDGQGLAHPRRFGIACHIGVLTGFATIGCAKTRLCGYSADPGPFRGDYTDLIDRNEIIGAVVRTRKGVKPVFVSIGHRIDLPSSVAYVMGCCRRYRLPEPTRLAHHYAKACLKKNG